ncbi:MAG: hypothetical protein KAU31_12185 [Spirochaetaceae bacterium]|nr:hypothetical protein [Spirochaetaceae bacterium]
MSARGDTRGRGFVRAVYIIGAVIDGLTIIPMLLPKVGMVLFRVPDLDPGPEYFYAIGTAAALMAGWTVLLAWGAVRPVERRAVLLFTIAPVVIGLIGAGINGVLRGFSSWSALAPTMGMQVVIIALLSAAYIVARKLARHGGSS